MTRERVRKKGDPFRTTTAAAGSLAQQAFRPAWSGSVKYPQRALDGCRTAPSRLVGRGSSPQRSATLSQLPRSVPPARQGTPTSKELRADSSGEFLLSLSV